MRMQIRDIVKRDCGDFYRFHISCGKIPALIMRVKPFGSTFGNTIRLDTSTKRLIQLANDILSYFEQEAKIREWKPSNEEFVWALERRFGKGNGMDFFVIDWVRQVVALKDEDNIKQAQHMYEWLKSNEDWLYGRK